LSSSWQIDALQQLVEDLLHVLQTHFPGTETTYATHHHLDHRWGNLKGKVHTVLVIGDASGGIPYKFSKEGA
jgi:hypothetical protein